MTNAQPILTDIDARDGGIDVSSITEKVDAVIPVHIYGNPCDFDSVKDLCRGTKNSNYRRCMSSTWCNIQEQKKLEVYQMLDVFHFIQRKT